MDKPFIFTLFGSTGDLAQKKIVPALFNLFKKGQFKAPFSIVAFSRRHWNDEEYRAFIRPYLTKHTTKSVEHIDAFLEHIVYAEGHFTEQHSFKKLKQTLDQEEKNVGKAQQLFYFSVQPSFYTDIIKGLDSADIFNDRTKVLIEKPFGTDVPSAEELEKLLVHHLHDSQIYRVDHYLAKGGFEALLEARKTDHSLEAKLNNKHISKIIARIRESIGIEGRGEFYDATGALIDVGQNHLLEMLAAGLMDIEDPDQNKARADVIASLTLKGEPVFGQYEGYREEEGVSPQSKTETYFMLQAESSLPRWKGVPIILEAGKALKEKAVDVMMIPDTGNPLIAPMNIKRDKDDYEIVIEEALLGNKGYFASLKEIIAAWKFLAPVFKKRATLEVKIYPPQSNGPLA
jgi:glucose-6-phosphate 1-dehydrogenase